MTDDSGERVSVLLVEDSPGDANLVLSALTANSGDESFSVVWVNTVTKALAALREREFACVLLDLGLPDGEGIEALESVVSGAADAPVVVLTGRDEEFAQQALQRGAQDYLPKNTVDAGMITRALRYAMERQRFRAQLDSNEQHYRSVFEASAEGMVVLSPSGDIQAINSSALRILGFDAGGVSFRDWSKLEWRAAEDGSPIDDPTAVTLRTGKLVTGVEVSVLCPHGGHVWLEVDATPLRREGDPSVYAAAVAFRDLTDRRAAVSDRILAEAERTAAETRFRLGFEQSPVGVAIIDLDGRFTQVNPALSTLLGRTDADLVGMRLTDYVHPEDALAPAVLDLMLQHRTETFHGERRYLRPDGSTVWALVSISLVRDADDQPEYLFGQFQDVTERRQIEDALEYLAVHDALTQLPNRTLLTDRIKHALERAQRGGRQVGVLFVDLDQFKMVNDSMGHSAGDQLLIEVARRLTTVVRPSDTVARFGGDEFAIVCEDLHGAQDAAAVGDRIAKALETPVIVDNSEVFVTASIGVAVGAAGVTAEAIMRDADAAMYRAKENGRARIEVFDDVLRRRVSNRLETEVALRHALDRNEFTLVYQPIVRLPDQRLVGCEALIRWQHPDRGLVLPGEFIPLAEDMGLIVALGRWVFDTALTQLVRWQHDLPNWPRLWMSINASARQLGDPDLVHTVAAAVRAAGVDPKTLHVEITESVVMGDATQSIYALTALKRLGLHLCVDDFGTGYSSLSYLKQLPIDTLKIDQSFVRGLGVNADDSAIVRAIARLGDALGLELVAEGVETCLQYDELRELGCQYGQGFAWSRPIPPGEFARRWLIDNGSRV